MNVRTGAAQAVKTLEILGVKTLFGIPGIHNLDLYDALLDSPIEVLTTRHEQGAAFAADGYGRMTGEPGVALVIGGPGLTNALTPLGQAFHDSVPLLLLSSDVPRAYGKSRRGFLHELRDGQGMARSVCKESLAVTEAADIAPAIERGWTLCRQGRPGPVHVQIPLDLLAQRGSFDDPRPPRRPSAPLLPQEPFDEALSLLREAPQAAFVAGGGARHARSLTELVEKLGAPLATTCAGKGILDEGHPLSLGTTLHLAPVRAFLESVDVLVVVGSELSPTDLWENPLRPRGKVIRVDVDPSHFTASPQADVALAADGDLVVGALAAALERRPYSVEERGRTVRRLLDEARSSLPSVTGLGPLADEVRSFLRALRRGLPREGVLFADMTTPAYMALSEFPVAEAGLFFHPVGFGTLGWALPAALGARAADRQRPLVVLCGDGGFQFTLPELALAVESRLPLVIVIWNDGGFGEIRRNEELRHRGRTLAVDQSLPDLPALARAYGVDASVLFSPRELETALSQALASGKTTLIDYRSGGQGR
ncbi:thiamine pyrophosphate-binding protein [Aminirod propionatiphilus]|uniref:Thiamine pyrophosphate-binding protein n=1 Tax=Aminirod propionatiphilus TaxID=3415223 RepID=A0ACD1DW18_9BACT|nr:thiamine pyrophosphate-binding protein [Synergistota bacterium]